MRGFTKVSALLACLLFQLVFYSVDMHAEYLPEIQLKVPEEEKQREYLGLQEKKEEFQLSEIKTDILVIELFSMYCPYCQKEAPLVNELFQLAQKQQRQDGDGPIIKIIGIGASNTFFEVEFFRQLFDIEFPLFPDKSLEMYKSLGGEGTPGFIICLFKQGESPKIIHRLSGGFDNAEDFFQLMLEKANLFRSKN